MTVSERQMPTGPGNVPVAVRQTHLQSASRLIDWARANRALLAVFLAFALAAFVVPTLAPVATTDDWAYARSAQILLEDGRLTVFPVVAATAVFQIVWGALFGLLLSPTLGVFRLSTVVITSLGALALYGLCRELGVSRERSALGVAAYLFNPLVFVLAFTFMTDAHFAALLVIATWLFVKALTPSALGEGSAAAGRGSRVRTPVTATIPPLLTAVAGYPRSGSRGRGVRGSVGEALGASPEPATNGHYILAGSAATALAFLTRQQGALIVPGVLLFLLLTRRLRLDRASLVLFLQIVTLPALTMVGYFLWLRFGNDVPRVQASFFREALAEGWSGTWWLLRRLTVVELMYVGFFTLPLMAAVAPFARDFIREIPRRSWLLVALWVAAVGAGVVNLWQRGARMPYIAQFFGAGGLGPPDVLGSRPRLFSADDRAGLTILCLAASLLLALVAARATWPSLSPGALEAGEGQAATVWRSRAGLVFSIGLWQVIGVLPPSYHYIGWAAGSLDRYLLPLAPLAIALALWGLRGARLALPLGWGFVIALALFSVAGTRDYLVFMREVWALGERAVAAGVPLERLDAGSGWDGYYLYERGLEQPIRSRTPKGGPWWVYFYAPATDSSYVVASKPLSRYVVIEKRPYSSWLQRQPSELYLLRRRDAPWPPGEPSPPTLMHPVPGRPQSSGARQSPPTAPMPTVAARDGLSTATENVDDQWIQPAIE